MLRLFSPRTIPVASILILILCSADPFSRIRFFTATGLVTQLLEKREDRQLERFQKQLERLHLIVLDELGYVPFYAKARLPDFMTIPCLPSLRGRPSPQRKRSW